MLQNNDDTHDETHNKQFNSFIDKKKFSMLIDRYKKYIREDNIDGEYHVNFSIITMCMSQYYDFIKEYEDKYNNSTCVYFKALYYYCGHEDNKLEKLFELNKHINNSHIYFLQGFYYYNRYYNKHDLIKEYYLKAIELNNTDAMVYLGKYYYAHCLYENMKPYYLMAIKLGYDEAMYLLGKYYLDHTQDNCLIEKYLLMAIEQNNDAYYNAFCSLRLHFKKMRKDNDYIWKFIYFPRIFTLILISMRRIQNPQKNNTKQPLFFLPEELYITIFNEHLMNFL